MAQYKAQGKGWRLSRDISDITSEVTGGRRREPMKQSYVDFSITNLHARVAEGVAKPLFYSVPEVPTQAPGRELRFKKLC
jgi:hypothetical protein